MRTGVKRPEREDRPPPLSAMVKNEWNYTFTPPYTFVDYRHINFTKYFVDQDSSVGVAIYYVAGGPGIKSR
jgi:hypothetical protein